MTPPYTTAREVWRGKSIVTQSDTILRVVLRVNDLSGVATTCVEYLSKDALDTDCWSVVYDSALVAEALALAIQSLLADR
jgi:hypothetical protein